MKKGRRKRKKRVHIIGEIGIVSILLAVVFILIENFCIDDKKNISKADYSEVKIGATNFGDDYGLQKVSATTVNNMATGQKIMTVSSSFYNYRYDNEIKKGWRDQGIDGELSGVANPFSVFNNKLSTYYASSNTSLYGLYEGNFYNHWTGSYNAKNYNWCLKNYTGFSWAQNIANRGTYSAVCQGLVGNSLVGYEWTESTFNAGNIMCSDGTTILPLFNKKFLEQKYTDNETIGIGVVAEQVGFPFRYEHDSQKGSHYVFDSKYDVIRFANSESEGCSDAANTYKYYYGKASQSDSLADKPNLNYYYQKNRVTTRQNKSSQFLPFNKPTDAKNIDFGFGMRVDIPFYLTSDGMQGEADGGKPMKFNFEGDDDVWVFIDGKLVLDLGGAHAKTVGSIDFSGEQPTMTVDAKTVSYNKDTSNTTAGTNNFENGYDNTDVKASTTKKPINKDAVHVMTIFYMERGMIESNLYMDFNFIPHNEPIDPPVAGDTVKTDSEMTVRTKIDFSQVANAFKAKVKKLAEDDAFRYKIENVGTGTGNIQDSGIEYPSELLSVRENEGKRTYWSFGKRPKIRIYFDLEAAQANVSDANTGLQNGTVSGDNAAAYRTTWSKPYITVNNVRHEMESYKKDKIYYFDVNKDDEFYFTSDKNVQQFGQPAESISSKASGKIYINGKTYDYTFVVENGVLYKPVGFINNRQNGFVCESELANENHPANATSNHSMNLPYQTKGSSSTFVPTSETEYNPVASTTYNLTEAYPATTESYDALTMSGSTTIHIFENNQVTSGKTDVDGIFSLLDGNSATFLKQFRMDSNMRIVTQEYLGKMVRSDPTGQINGNAYVSYATTGTRKSKDFYYTTVSAKNIISDTDQRDVDVNKIGEFKFANVKASDTDADFTASDKITISETFTNQVKTGNLCISKKITGMKNAGDLEYTFKIQFKNVFGVTDSDYTGYALDYVLYDSENNGTTKTLKADDPTVTLKQGEKVIIEGIPAGTEYQIVETNPTDVVAGDISVSYTTKVDGVTKMQTDVDMDNLGTGDNISEVTMGTTGTIVGTIPNSVKNSSTSEQVNEFDEVDINITFTNQKGVIRLEKLAIGEWKNFKDEEYTFKITDSNNTPISDGWEYDIYEYNKTTGDEEVVKSQNKIGDNGEINIKATQWALIQDIPLTSDTTYKITETGLNDEGTYFKVNSIDVNTGNCTQDANLTDGTVSMELSNTNPKIDITYVNRYDPSYVKIAKYVDCLYYQDKDGKEQKYSNDITYQSLTDTKQSFIFKIEEYTTQAKAEDGTDVQGTFYVTIPIAANNSANATFDKQSIYKYGNSEIVKLTLGKWYRISEETDWSWKYDLQGLVAVVGTEIGKNIGTVSIPSNKKYAIFEGGDEDCMPTIEFYNTLTTDTTKLGIEGDTDSIPNIIKKE